MNSETKFEKISEILRRPEHRQLLADCRRNDELFVAAQFYLAEGSSDWLCFKVRRNNPTAQVQTQRKCGENDAADSGARSGEPSMIKTARQSGSQVSEIVGFLKIINGSGCNNSVVLVPATNAVRAFHRNLEAIK